MKFEYKGLISSMITPLKDSGSRIDDISLQAYCDFLITKGVRGVFICGTTAEGPLLSTEERMKVAEIVVNQMKNQAKVIVHTGNITTETTLKLCEHAQKIGADGIGVVLPYYHSFDEDALVAHFLSVSRAVPDMPFFIYNIPQCTVNNLTPAVLARILDKADNLTGIKTSNPDLFQLQEYLKLLGPDKPVFFGCDRLDLAALALGATGIISGNSSAFPEPFLKLFELFKNGDWIAARRQHEFNYKLAMILRDGNYPAVYKKCLEWRGIKVGNVRRPHQELSPEEAAKLKNSLIEIGLLN